MQLPCLGLREVEKRAQGCTADMRRGPGLRAPGSVSVLWPLEAGTGLSLLLRVQSRPVLVRPSSEGHGPCSGGRPAWRQRFTCVPVPLATWGWGGIYYFRKGEGASVILSVAGRRVWLSVREAHLRPGEWSDI